MIEGKVLLKQNKETKLNVRTKWVEEREQSKDSDAICIFQLIRLLRARM